MLRPQDSEAHVVSPAKLDFALRSLRVLEGDLEGKFGVPLRTEVVERKDVTGRVLELCRRWETVRVFAHMGMRLMSLGGMQRLLRMGWDMEFRCRSRMTYVALPGDVVTKVFFSHSYCYCPLLPYSCWSVE